MENLNEIWDNANGNDRHITDELSSRKIELNLKNFEELYLPHINIDEVTTSLDWGCGGGLLAKELGNFSDKVYGVDVSIKSIESCKKYAPNTELFLLEGDPSSIELPKVDLVLANAIVWHFPSVDYFKTVVAKWVSLDPKYVMFNTKQSNTTKETGDYSKDFINSLFLSDDDVVSLMSEYGYTLVNKSVSKNTLKSSSYFTFKK